MAIETDAEGFPVRVEKEEGAIAATSSAILSVPSANEKVVNAPITWAQFGGALLNEYLSPPVLLAIFVSIGNWFASGVPITSRAVVQAVIVAIIAGLEAAKSMSGNSALALRLRAMGQIGGGK